MYNSSYFAFGCLNREITQQFPNEGKSQRKIADIIGRSQNLDFSYFSAQRVEKNLFGRSSQKVAMLTYGFGSERFFSDV